MHKRTFLLGVAAAAASAATLAMPAAADDPRIPVDFQPFDLPATICGFPIHVGLIANNTFIVRTETAADGTVTERTAGNLVLSFTNLNTGATIVRNVSGPGTTTFNPDGTVVVEAQGPWVFFFGPRGQANTGRPGLVFTTGFAVLVFDGPPQSLTVSGHEENGCALLAA